jgi:hypothetical protein
MMVLLKTQRERIKKVKYVNFFGFRTHFFAHSVYTMPLTAHAQTRKRIETIRKAHYCFFVRSLSMYFLLISSIRHIYTFKRNSVERCNNQYLHDLFSTIYTIYTICKRYMNICDLLSHTYKHEIV